MSAQLELFKNNLPIKARSCDHFKIDNKVRQLAYALEKRYIQPNDFNSRQWLVYDIDRPTCPDEIRNDKLAPEPTIFVNNPANGHAHLFYLLKTPVHDNPNSSQKALRFAAAVDVGLAMKLEADMSYAGLLAKNAVHEQWRILDTVPQAYELHELAECVDLTLLNEYSKDPVGYGLGRNCIVFDKLRQWSYKAIRQGFPSYERWLKAVEQRAEMINSTFKHPYSPLDYAELKHIVKSVANWTHRNITSQGFSEWQSAQGRKGGIAKGNSYAEKRLEARMLRKEGKTYQQIADEIGASKRSIITWCK